MKIWETYLRWRHTKGYGVHSPYAFRFLKDVVRPGNYGYYAYDNLEKFARGEYVERNSFFKEVRFLIRLCIFLKTKRIITIREKNSVAGVTAKALQITYFNSKTSEGITFKEGDLLLLSNSVKEDSNLINKAIGENVPVYSILPGLECRKVIETPIDRGVLFNGNSELLLIPRKEMEYVSYTIRF